jgi:hypothetical protein
LVRGSVVQLCADLPCGADDVFESRAVAGFSDKDVEVLTMDRQYSPQKKFLSIFRNFRKPGEPDGSGSESPGSLSSAISKMVARVISAGAPSAPRVLIAVFG